MSKDNTENNIVTDSDSFEPVIDSHTDGELEYSKYSEFLEDFDLTEKQKLELLETLWAIMRSFVELGFSADICGHFFENQGEGSESDSEGVKSNNSATKETPSSASGKKTSP